VNIKTSVGSYWGTWGFGYYYEVSIQLTGRGTINDPYVISTNKSMDNDYTTLNISNSSDYLNLKDFKVKALYLKDCENVIISNANVKILGLSKCNKISVQKSEIIKQLRIGKCFQLKINDSYIDKLIAFSGTEISFSNCDIKKISRKSKAEIQIEA
jgi:hypothetical protein